MIGLGSDKNEKNALFYHIAHFLSILLFDCQKQSGKSISQMDTEYAEHNVKGKPIKM